MTYSSIYYNILLIVVLITFIYSQIKVLGSEAFFSYTNKAAWVLFFFVLLYIGLRPFDDTSSDMNAYLNHFNSYKLGLQTVRNKDVLFGFFTKVSAQELTSKMYFFVIACLYVIPLYFVSKKWFKKYWFYGFLFFVCSFSFWSYGTNTIRNGVAGSLFLLGMSRDKRIWKITFILLAIGFHKTMILPAAAYILVSFYNKPKIYTLFWFVCILLSLMWGDFFKNVIGTLGIDDVRMSYFTTEVEVGKFSRTGFRWDFLLYSSTAIFAGWYYTLKKEYKDKVYSQLFNTYLITNSFWVLVNTANFSDRFAYLSWFMMPLIIIYPLLNMRFFRNQNKKIGMILIAYYGFTFIMRYL